MRIFTDQAVERFFAKINFNGPKIVESPCWEWTHTKNHDGYGMFFMNDKYHRAHRVFFEMMKGVIPPDRPVLMHRCDNPACVNPAHLVTGTDLENAKDAAAKGRRIKKDVKYYSAEFAAELRAQIASGAATAAELRKKYGINQRTMRHLTLGQRKKDAVGRDVLAARCPKCARILLNGETCRTHGEIPADQRVYPTRKPVDVAQAVALRAQGLTQKEIAKRLGVSAPAVCQALKRYRSGSEDNGTDNHQRSE